VPDGETAFELRQRFAVENVRDVAHFPPQPDEIAVGSGDARALLAAVLQRVESEVGHVGGFGMPEDAEHAAFVLEGVEFLGH
jgi:hypothetical protein